MKLLIVSDIHANYEALKRLDSIEADYDHLVFLGDAVDYGPEPKGCIDFIKKRAYRAVRGNHDNALAYNTDCGCSSKYKHLSLETRRYNRMLLDNEDISYLAGLPLMDRFALGDSSFFMTHASPKGDLYRYLYPQMSDDAWGSEIDGIDAGFVLLGHIHIPFVRKIGSTTIINPGSAGQPRDGDPRGSYAIWENGVVILKRFSYDIDKTIDAIERSGMEEEVVKDLSSILRSGA